MQQVPPAKFFALLKWIDGKPLEIEPYRQHIFDEALYSFDGDRPRFNLVLSGRAKKNWKSADLILAALYRLLAWKSTGGNQAFILANDEGQAGDDLELAKKLIAANPVLRREVDIKLKIIERKDGNGFLQILPAGDVAGAHGKTYCFCGFDEIHEYRNWDLLEAMALDPTRPDAMQWITSYASIYHKPGVPLFDLMAQGWKGEDPRMLFSWYGADKSTDLRFAEASPEDRANPSRGSWDGDDYLEQQQRRLPAHKYRRLHLNLPGLPEGAAYTAEMIMGSVDRGCSLRLPVADTAYVAFTDMSGGSSDDTCLAIAHKDADGRGILDRLIDQGQRPPFDPRRAVARFVEVLKDYGVASVTGDRYAGETFRRDFQDRGIAYRVAEKTKSQLYEAFEPHLNAHEVVLLDAPNLESQLLGLSWRGGKIDHAPGEHDDHANAAVGALFSVLDQKQRSWAGSIRASVRARREGRFG